MAAHERSNPSDPAKRRGLEPVHFDTAAAFRGWLRKHHGSTAELLVALGKRAQKRPGMSWREAVDEALCFGWIDGVRKRIDATSYTVRFTPRKAGSTWSAVNIRRATALEAEGRMQPAGRRAFDQRSEKKSRTYSYERADEPELAPALERRLRAEKRAWTFFQAQAPSYRRKIVHWIMAGKQDATRASRLQRARVAFAAGSRL